MRSDALRQLFLFELQTGCVVSGIGEVLLRSSDASYPSLRTQTANLCAEAADLRCLAVPRTIDLFFADAVRFILVQ